MRRTFSVIRVSQFLPLLGAAIFSADGRAADAVFYRAVNLNGPELVVDGQKWEGRDAKNFSASGKVFENQKVALRPATDAARAGMIRSSVWGDKVDVTFSSVPPGDYQIFIYVWEDNHNERFNLLVNESVVFEGFQSGTEGAWKRLGPYAAVANGGRLTVAARGPSHGAANLSGVEIWSGNQPLPAVPESPKFAAAPTPVQVEFFEKRIRPALVEHCYECHSADAKKLKGGLLLDSRIGVAAGGDSGPVIAPGDPDASLLVQALRHQSEDVAMPPRKKLPAPVIADFEAWVKMGAPDPRTADTRTVVKERSSIDWVKGREWWSLRPLVAPAVPVPQDKGWERNDIDRFVLARMGKAGLMPVSDASARDFIRRAIFDLTGLPPTPVEVDEFAPLYAANADKAVEALVERLLSSPRYGERWGRHWLDVVRYADTAGDNSDFPIPQMRRYRDWVIDAFNRDQPYDEFVRDQIAGDLRGGSEDEKLRRLVATGYISNARRFGSRVDDYPQHLTIEDTIDNLGRTFLGLSVNCSRCHDHKFDPISTQDYYALYGIFNSTRYPWPGIELEQKQRDLVPLAKADEVAGFATAKKSFSVGKGRLEAELKKLKDSLKTATPETKPDLDAAVKAAEESLSEHSKRTPRIELAYAVSEGAKPGDVAVQMKGDPAKPGDAVNRRFLTVLGGWALSPAQKGSGRSDLADWLVRPENPLTARVMANRIWHYHFGRGIVPTPNDFGKQGKPPANPELLDYVAVRFRDGGWSVKAMHRLIMNSRTYRLASERGSVAIEKDPSNEFLSGFPRLRLDAESMRDSLLALGGNLDLSPAGEHPFPPENEWKFTQHKPFKAVYDSDRRSIFLMTQRIQRHPFLALFDGADPSTSTPARPASTTPLQALFLLNDPFLHEQAGRITERVFTAGSDDQARVHFAMRLLFSRPPEPAESDAAARYLEASRKKLGDENEAWRSYVRVLLRLNEFVYVD